MNVLAIVFCLISQGPKGNYPTLLYVYKEDSSHVYVRSDGKILEKDSAQPLHKIHKKHCRPVVRYK